MKTKLILASLLISLAFISCKKEEGKEDNKSMEVVEEKVNPNTFKVEIDAIIPKDDELILFWKDPSVAYFDAKNTIYYGVKGNPESQKIIFEFEEGIIPNDIRLDISSKKGQSPIVINSIKFSKMDRSFVITKDKIEEYFTPNEFIKYDAATATATAIENNGNYDPFFNTKPAIYVELEKVLNTTF